METNGQNNPALVTLSAISVNTGGNHILANIDLIIQQGQQWAIVGLSGSGKTTLAHVLQGQIFYRGELTYHFPNDNKHIELVEQQHHFKNLTNTGSFYYQQRFNASE